MVFLCPVARTVNDGALPEAGTIWTCAFAFRPDGAPAFAQLEHELADTVSDTVVLAALDKKDGQDPLSSGLRFAGLQERPENWDGYKELWRPAYDDLTLQDAFARWLRQRLGDALPLPDAKRAAASHLGSSPLRELLDRFEAGPARAFLDQQDWYDAQGWLALNGADNRGTPALELCRAWPVFADAIIRHAARSGFPPDEPLGAADVASAVLTNGKRPFFASSIRHAPADLAPVIERMRGLDIDTFAPFPNKSITTQYETLSFVAALPPAWCPLGSSDWGRVAQVSSDLLGLIEHHASPAIVLAQSCGGRWAEWIERVLHAARPPGSSLLGSGMIAVNDAHTAFGQQVAFPLMVRPTGGGAYAGRFSPLTEAYQTARRVVFAGLPAETVFERAAHWHEQSESMEAELAGLSAGTASNDSWPAAIPSAVIRVDEVDIEVLPLTSRAMLLDEAKAGFDAQGVAGLKHRMAAKRYVESCLSGTGRIVSLRRRDAAGAIVRLSTAKVAFEFGGAGEPGAPLYVRIHRGRDAGAPPAEAVQAIETYLAQLSGPDPMLHVDLAAYRGRPGSRSVDTMCGYDAAIDANIEVALRLWEEYLPERLRGLSLDAFATALGISELRREGPA
ncbi:hypothetical protein [Bradyrhizobium macuxiense]|uniref:hypothetical protein n=1 Tax=Bradyrhizobium macuxiense TaxID=1755647 RepID=UPI0011BD7206|nr:hypothetical protein [Bradyrhizobium macuxiense]